MRYIQVSVTINGRTKERAVYPEDNIQGLVNLLYILVRQRYQYIMIAPITKGTNK